MVWCAAVYGSSASNYVWYRLWERSHNERQTYLTQRHGHRLVAKYNSPQDRVIFDDKVIFSQRFREFLGREWVAIDGSGRAELRAFLERHEKLVAKPRSGRFGGGVEVLTPGGRSIDDLMAYLLSHEKGFGIAEEYVVQHPALSEVYSGAVAVARIVTIVDGGVTHSPAAAITFAASGEVSNLWQGGLSCAVDVESGTVSSPAVTRMGAVHRMHPHSGRIFQGLTLPFWEEALDLVSAAARVVETIRYVGWDVAFTEAGPVIIEGNTVPGYTTLQHPDFVAIRGSGLKPRFEQFL